MKHVKTTSNEGKGDVIFMGIAFEYEMLPLINKVKPNIIIR
jgi:hypothetical protein